MKKIPLEQFLKNCIETMENAGRVNMAVYQHTERGVNTKTTTEELHRCNTAACFAGWVAVSDWWRELGGTVDPKDGAPDIYCAETDKFLEGADALAHIIDHEDGNEVSVLRHLWSIVFAQRDIFGAKWSEDIEAKDVVKVLQRWLDTGTPRIQK